jgi:hypothetical protein
MYLIVKDRFFNFLACEPSAEVSKDSIRIVALVQPKA